VSTRDKVGLLQQAVIVGVAADPEPDQIVAIADGQRTKMQADADRPVAARLLEVQRWMAGSALSRAKFRSASLRTCSGSRA